MKWGWTKLVFGKAQTFGLSYDDPDVTDPQRMRYDACMVVKDATRTRREVQTQSFDGGYFAVTVHEGPYATLGETYARLFAHIVTHPIGGRRWRLGDPPSLEHYLNDPRKTAPEGLRTKIMMRVT
jgi:AraC family transcriptional regulator